MTVEAISERFGIYEWTGLSTDEKPTHGAVGSTFYEEDTGDKYLFGNSGWSMRKVNIKTDSYPLVVIPPIAAAAFSANDIVGGKLTLANAVRSPGGSGVLHNLILVDISKQNDPLEVYVFSADLDGTYLDNAAEAVTAADWSKCLGVVRFYESDYITLANVSIAVPLVFRGLPVKAAPGTTNLYALSRTTGTPTYGVNALQLTFGFLRD